MQPNNLKNLIYYSIGLKRRKKEKRERQENYNLKKYFGKFSHIATPDNNPYTL